MAYNVLVVDDSRTTRTIIAKALRHSGVELGDIHFAADGLEALELLQEHWVDIIFADLNMPRLTGVEMVERMAAHDLLASVPVVIVSTEGRQDRIDALLAKGVAAYLRKPFVPAEVGAVAATLLGGGPGGVGPARWESAESRLIDVPESFFDALEGFAMLVAQQVDRVPSAPEHAVMAHATARGPAVELDVVIATSAEGAVAIGEAALGETGESEGQDAVRELVNLVAGHVVDSLSGGPFTLSVPDSRALDGTRAWAEATAAHVALAFDLEGCPLLLGVSVKERW